MSVLWGGRFEQSLTDAFTRFNQSLPFDRRLFFQEIHITRAFIQGLATAQILNDTEHQALNQALQTIEDTIADDHTLIDQAIQQGIEDIHSFVENELVNHVGELAYKANTGRSRNEQIAATMRLWTRQAINTLLELIDNCQQTLLQRAEEHCETVLLGYTHMQRAQPVTWGHFLMAYVEMLQRDRERLADTLKRTDVSPLGCGALAGNSWGLDRAVMAETAGFTSVSRNSIDSVSDRDFVIEFLATASLLASHFSRLAEDLIIHSTTEFATVEMSDQVTTGSSLMPQKKNPDAMELVRGKSARVYGNFSTLLCLTKGLPSCYNKDLQEDKEPLFDTYDTVHDMLTVAITCIQSMQIKASEKPAYGYITATEIADYLACRGLPFRQAHHLVGQIVNYASEQNKTLAELSLDEYQRFSHLFDYNIHQCISIDSAIAMKNTPGGTAVEQVRQQIAAYRHSS